VRGTIYLWGSAGILVNLSFDRTLHLHILNEHFGEGIAIATVVAGGAQTALGTLGPGECVTIPLQNITGVVATCANETTVKCLIH